MHDVISKFSEHLRSVLTRALTITLEQKHKEVQPIHILWALSSQQGSIAADVLQKSGADSESLRFIIEALPTQEDSDIPLLSNKSKSIVEKAVAFASEHGHTYVGTEHALAALLEIGSKRTTEYFEEFAVDIQSMKQSLAAIMQSMTQFPNQVTKKHTDEFESEDDQSDQPALDYFTENITQKAKEGLLDPVIGRAKEIERALHILGRRSKNNPLFIGEPGVGKTAIVEGLAQALLESKDKRLANVEVLELNMPALLAGTMYRGEFESRLRQLLEEIEERGNVVLFIDEVHTIMGAGAASGSLDAANMLKPALARGQIRCIGATTPAEYKKHIESDGAMERRFRPVQVYAPNKEQTFVILKGIAPRYAEHHNVSFSDEALLAAIDYAHVHMPQKQFPDKAIDILDEAGSAFGKPHRKRKQKRLLKTEKQNESANQTDGNALKSGRNIIGEKEIKYTIQHMTGARLQSPTKTQFSSIRRMIRKNIIGQDHAVDTALSAILRAKLGLRSAGGPLTTLFFTGPSGTGKTALGVEIGKHLLDDMNGFLRLDMSEFSAPFTSSKLFGAPAGYVGYRESAKLTDHVKQHPHSVILFDEIEKAHSEIHHALLQILDSGFAQDATGRQIDFRQTILIFSSNVGGHAALHGALGFDKSTKHDLPMHEYFSTEFMARMKHICVFKPLEEKHLRKVAQKELEDLHARIQVMGLELHWSNDVAKHLAKQSKKQAGARSIQQAVESQVEQLIAELILKKDTPSRIELDVEGAKIQVKNSL